MRVQGYRDIGPIFLTQRSRMAHLASHSGYDQLPRWFGDRAEAIAPDIDHSVARVRPLPARLALRAARSVMTGDASDWYSLSSFARVELPAARRWLAEEGRVFHFIHGETHYRHLGILSTRCRRNRLVASFHLPVRRLEALMPAPRWLSRLDAVIALGQTQGEWLARWAGRGRVHCVRHGVDTAFFSPDQGAASRAQREGPLRCFFVGAHMRDFQVLRATIDLLNSQESGRFHFDLALLSARRAEFACLPNTTVHQRLSDEELRGMYRSAAIVFQPMTDCVANNSVLESLACGTPVVATDVGDVRDYLDDSCAVLARAGDAEACAGAIVEMTRDRAVLSQRGVAARERAETCAWPRVVDELRRVYEAAWALP